jgi:hypothetical protein
VASAAISTMSAASTSPTPPPATVPCTTLMTGTGALVRAWMAAWSSSATAVTCRARSCAVADADGVRGGFGPITSPQIRLGKDGDVERDENVRIVEVYVEQLGDSGEPVVEG